MHGPYHCPGSVKLIDQDADIKQQGSKGFSAENRG
jgi:hypothetical protein